MSGSERHAGDTCGLISSNLLSPFCKRRRLQHVVAALSRYARPGADVPFRAYSVQGAHTAACQGGCGTTHFNPIVQRGVGVCMGYCAYLACRRFWGRAAGGVSRKKGRRLFSTGQTIIRPRTFSLLFAWNISHHHLSRSSPSRAADLVPLKLVQTTPKILYHPPNTLPPHDQGIATRWNQGRQVLLGPIR